MASSLFRQLGGGPTQSVLQQRVSSLSSGIEVANIIVSLSLIAIVIPTLFFTLGSAVESQVVSNNAFYIVDGLTGDVKDILTPDQIAKIKPVLEEYLVPPDMADADASVVKKNASLVKSAYKVIAIGVGIALAFVLLIWMKTHFHIKHVLIENLFIVLGIALTEISILLVIGKHYKSAQMNTVKRQLIEALQKYAAT
jgi:hypothetical protein